MTSAEAAKIADEILLCNGQKYHIIHALLKAYQDGKERNDMLSDMLNDMSDQN